MENIELKLLKEQRTQKNYSQEKLALISGVSKRTIQRIERGEKCSNTTARLLARALDIQNVGDLQDSSNSLSMDDWAVRLSSLKHSARSYHSNLLVVALLFSIPVSAIWAMFFTEREAGDIMVAGFIPSLVYNICSILVICYIMSKNTIAYKKIIYRELDRRNLSDSDLKLLKNNAYLDSKAAGFVESYLTSKMLRRAIKAERELQNQPNK